MSSFHSNSCDSQGLTNFSCPFYFIDRNSACSPDLSCHVTVFLPGTAFLITTTATTGETSQSALSVKNDDQRFTVLLTLRVTALYGSVRWLVWLIWLGFAGFHSLRVAVSILGQYVVFGKVTFSQPYQQTDLFYTVAIVYSPINHICELSRIGNRSTAVMAILPAIFDLSLLILTANKALRGPVSLKSNSIVREKF